MNWSDALHILRYALGVGLIAANVAVWYGVWLEREAAPKDVQERGWRILVKALAAEAALGLFLFAADTGIDVMQRTENAITYERATNAEREAGRLGVDIKHIGSFVSDREKEISSQLGAFKKFAANEKAEADQVIADLKTKQGELAMARNDAVAAANNAKADITKAEDALKKEAAIRDQLIAMNLPRGIADGNRPAFHEKLKPFAGITANVWTIGSSSTDSGPLATTIAALIKEAGWHAGEATALGGWAKYVLVEIGAKPKPNVESAAMALVLALRANGILAFVVTDQGPEVAAAATGTILPNPDMAIVVGSKQ